MQESSGVSCPRIPGDRGLIAFADIMSGPVVTVHEPLKRLLLNVPLSDSVAVKELTIAEAVRLARALDAAAAHLRLVATTEETP